LRLTHARLKLLVVGATLVVLLALGLFVHRMLSRGEQLTVSAAEGVVTRAADVAQSLLNRHLLQVEGQLASLGELLGQGFLDRQDPDRSSNALREMTAHSLTFRNLMLAGLDGEVWASAVEARRGRPVPVPAELLHAHMPLEAPAILGPVPDPQTGELMLIVLRRIPAEHSDVLAVAEVPTALITAGLAPMVNPPELRIRLQRYDGEVLAAGPGQESLEGRRLTEPRQIRARMNAVVRSPNRQGKGEVFGTARAIFYPGLLAIAVLPTDVALAEWNQIHDRILGGAVLVTTLLVAFSTALLIALNARQRAALEREAANRRLVDAVESLPDGFVLWDAEDRLVVSNKRYRTLMGVGEDVLVPGFRYEELVRGWLARGLYKVHEPVPVEKQVATALQSHRSADGYFERELADGRWLRVAKQRVAGGGTVVILCEITAARQTMAALAEARDVADRATAAKSRLLAHVSHELRTPLASLLRLADRLGGEANISAGQRRQAVLVGATARHLLALANEVLDLAAMEARSLTLNIAPAEPAEVFTDALAMVQPLAEAKAVRLSYMAEGLPARIEADATRLRQMVLNLLANAVKFTPPGSTVRLDATVHSSPPLLRFEVSDQGPGVPDSERNRLFTDFTRLAPAETEGTGLGLSITARLAALMKGRIGYADARGGTGACFWVELPIVLASERRAGLEAPQEEVRSGHLRLLAVDDVPANLLLLRALLAGTDIELATATGGLAALEAVAAAEREGRPFDAVLMDMMMPGMDGIEATRRLRAMPGAASRLPVIALTASAFPEDVATCRAAGMAGHLVKPVERASLLRLLAELNPKAGAELRGWADRLEAAAGDRHALLEAVQSIAGGAGPMGEQEIAAAARDVLRALRDDDPAAAEQVQALLAALRSAHPRFSVNAAA